MREETRANREMQIINAATQVFAKKGIDNTTMQDIATEVGFGVATVFRFFQKKEKLIVAVATKGLQDIHQQFAEIAELQISAYAKLELLLDTFIMQLESQHPINVIIRENFLSYLTHAEGKIEDMSKYNEVYRKISAIYASIIAQGQLDQSIRADQNIMSTIISAFGIFANRLSLHQKYILVDNDLPPLEQLQILKRIFLAVIRPV